MQSAGESFTCACQGRVSLRAPAVVRWQTQARRRRPRAAPDRPCNRAIREHQPRRVQRGQVFVPMCTGVGGRFLVALELPRGNSSLSPHQEAGSVPSSLWIFDQSLLRSPDLTGRVNRSRHPVHRGHFAMAQRRQPARRERASRATAAVGHESTAAPRTAAPHWLTKAPRGGSVLRRR